MFVWRIRAALPGLLVAALASASHAQYTTDWLANTFGTLAAHIGNGARSMWVAPEGVIYTSSRWDENAGGVAIYQNGAKLGTIGSHDEFQGGAITGNATSIFVALGYSRTFGSGSVGRYNRGSKARELRIAVSTWTGIQNADVITGLATAGTLLYVSDFYGNRVRVYTTDGVWQRDIAVTQPGALAIDSAGKTTTDRASSFIAGVRDALTETSAISRRATGARGAASLRLLDQQPDALGLASIDRVVDDHVQIRPTIDGKRRLLQFDPP